MDKDQFLKEQLDLIKRKQTDSSIEWQDVTDFRADALGEIEHRDTIRKGSKLLLEYIDAGWNITPSSSISNIPEELAIKKERIKLQTEKLEFNKWLREYSRDELIAEKIGEAVKCLEPLEKPEPIILKPTTKAHLLTISDAHYGVEFNIKDLHGYTINEYSPEIFEHRMWELYYKVVDQINKDGITHLHIWDLGDALDGLLRANSQLMQLKYGVIDSSILYANFLSEWLNELSKHVFITFQMVKKSNHNQLRLLGQPKNAFDNEDMSKSMLALMKSRLKDNPNVKIVENPTGLAYSQLTIYTCLGGHFETKDLNKTMKDIMKIHEVPIDYLFTGHWHSSFSEEVARNSEVISVRSIIGVNPYSMSINKTANAGASMFVFDQLDGLVDEHKYKLH